ncbi:Radical S-adenosyl methionine domain-containing protein 2 [Colletotrichum tanaceti]|uniref:Radical S-adenosyl methionine domain-containing protein 2 n=1 Tax=Colletotrichum tanaceti TaxID=1306861 RepID=A0A4U6XU09_9PEZI|nr:Radical S-adenosyl methionine domain-containing protein 2 [Colletotrichum tanaceti]
MGILTSIAETAPSLFGTVPNAFCVMAVLVLTVAYILRGRPAPVPEGAATSEKPDQPNQPNQPMVDDADPPVSVNYFPSRECNYACGFCFHTNTSGYILPLDDAKRGMRLLKEAGMRKLNIAGGEPFLHPKFLGELLRYCKQDLGLESISIVSNGSKIQQKFLREHARYLDILAISCDSFVRDTNRAIGRGENGQADKDHVAQVFRIAAWCREYGIMFKLNTVVNIHNWDEDMAAQIAELAPFRWKVFQCLLVEGENEDETRVRDARKFLISEEQWQTFCGRHKHLPCYVPEDNETMAGSYLLLDERLRFLDKGDGPMKKSDSLLDVGVKKAMQQVRWDKGAFDRRGGVYEWQSPQTLGGDEACGGGGGIDTKELQW